MATNEIQEPLEPWVERIIDRALLKHSANCPMQNRVRTLELRFATLIGYMVGSGLIGGAAGAALVKVVFGAGAA